MALSDNLIAYWKMEETGTTTTRADSVGSADASSFTGTVAAGPSTGKLNNGMFTNNSGFPWVPNGSLGSITSDNFSVAGWFRHDSFNSLPPNGTGPLALGGYNKTDGWGIWSDGSANNYNLRARLRSSGASVVTISSGANPWTEGVYNHIALTRTQNGAMDLWLNGVSIANTANSGSTNFSATTEGLKLGSGSTAYGDWYIDEVGYWNTGLSSDDVSLLYNSGAGNFYDNDNPNEFDEESPPPICWNYTAQYKSSTKMFKLSGPGSFPKRINIPGNVDISTGKMIDDGREIDPSNYEVE